MKLFQSAQMMYRALGIHPPPPNHHPYNWKNSLAVFVLAQGFILTAAFCLFQASTVREYGDSFYAFITEFANAIYLLSNIRKITKIKQLIQELETFVQNRFHRTASMIIYHDLNETIEKLSKIIHFSLVKMSVPGIMLPFCLVSIFSYSTSESKEQAFRLPYPMMLPFNWRTPWGYSAVILDQTAAAFCTCLLESANVSFYICSCWMLVTIPRDIASDLTLLDGEKTHKERRKKFLAIVKQYADSRHFASEFSEIYEFIVTGIFLWTISTICCSLLVLQAELLRTQSIIELMSPVYLGIWSFITIYFYCELGEQVTSSFERFDKVLQSCDWYLFPIELQRMLPTFIEYAQQPVIIRGYGNTLCTRFSFNKSVKGGFSYFMMLRQVTGLD